MITLEKIKNEINEILESSMTWESLKALDLLLSVEKKLKRHFECECETVGQKGLTWESAKRWVGSMVNADGTRGAHWTFDQVKAVMEQRSICADPIKLWVAMNAEYSDRVLCNRRYGISDDNINYYVDAAMAFWIDDKDAVEDKEAAYYEHVVRH